LRASSNSKCGREERGDGVEIARPRQRTATSPSEPRSRQHNTAPPGGRIGRT
jgi:hypothetical protein